MLRCLLVSRDREALSVLESAMRGLEISAEVCAEMDRAVERLVREELHAVLVDYDVEHAAELLRLVRQNYNHNRVALAMVKGLASIQAAYDVGANLVLIKPVTGDAAARTLGAAKELLQRMARRAVRLPLPTLAYASLDGMLEQAMILDISEGGMAVQALEPVETSGALHLRFELPGCAQLMEATGEIAWSDASGRAGLRFVKFAESTQQQLKRWMLARFAAESHVLFFDSAVAETAPWGQVPQACAAAPATLLAPDAPQRLLAALVDGGIVLAASVLFAVILILVSRALPRSLWALPVGLAVPFLFAALYQYVFLAHPHGTPGMQMAEEGRRTGADPNLFCTLGPKPVSARMLAWLEAHCTPGAVLERIPALRAAPGRSRLAIPPRSAGPPPGPAPPQA